MLDKTEMAVIMEHETLSSLFHSIGTAFLLVSPIEWAVWWSDALVLLLLLCSLLDLALPGAVLSLRGLGAATSR